MSESPTIPNLRRRSSGVLLHPTSLPGPYGIGDLGPEARRFAEFLKEAGQSWWQMFPWGPPGMANSPYQVLSAFAGNTLLISPDDMVQDGFLPRAHPLFFKSGRPSRVDFPRVLRGKSNLFNEAFRRFDALSVSLKKAFHDFCAENERWLKDFSLFSALKEKHDGSAWTEWPDNLRDREPRALAAATAELAEEIRYHSFLQFLFFRQWRRLKAACKELGVGYIGDIPIFVAHDSSDVWAHREFFSLDERGAPTHVAGVPPDYFSKTGQRWGNPIYRWDVLKRNGYDWWVRRFGFALDLFDIVRLDHFIGFQNFWRIPADNETAVHGEWTPGPADDFFETVREKLGKLPFIAEDLGALTPAVEKLRDAFHLPGMKVLQFAFSNGVENPHLPHHYPENSVAYTGTHDNDTSRGWFLKATPEEKEFFNAYANLNARDIPWGFIDLLFASPANTVIVPVQDWLGLGSRGRMNRPGTVKGNWRWRLEARQLTPAIAGKLRELAGKHNRLPAGEVAGTLRI